MNRKPSKNKNQFKPNAQYSWEPTDEFVLTGLEIDKINKGLSAMAQSPEFQRHALLYEALLAFNQFFRTAVEEGAISEQPQEKEAEQEKRPTELSVVGEQEQEESTVVN